MFILYSIRGQGWLTRSTQTSSDDSQAKEFTSAEALDLCVTFQRAGRPLIPVRLADWQYVKKVANDKR